MTVYIVRIRGSNELVGIFWCENRYELFWLVDEFRSPCHCEYRIAHSGGMYWQGRIPPMSEYGEATTDEEVETYDKAISKEVSFCESTHEDLLYSKVKRRAWHAFPVAQEVYKKAGFR
jgi:hypothetical protein